MNETRSMQTPWPPVKVKHNALSPAKLSQVWHLSLFCTDGDGGLWRDFSSGRQWAENALLASRRFANMASQVSYNQHMTTKSSSAQRVCSHHPVCTGPQCHLLVIRVHYYTETGFQERGSRPFTMTKIQPKCFVCFKLQERCQIMIIQSASHMWLHSNNSNLAKTWLLWNSQ